MSIQQDFSLIKQTVDKYFDFMDEIGGNQYMVDFIPKVMIDTNKKHEGEEYAYLVPLASTVSEQDIKDLEKLFGHPIPESYRFFLCQRHYIELQLGGYCINFFSNLPGELAPKFKEIIDEQYGNVLERNYLPIAHFQDFGVLCLDANVKRAGNDYPVIMLDHEDGYEDADFYADNFLDMFNEFNSHLDEWIRNNRENRSMHQ